MTEPPSNDSIARILEAIAALSDEERRQLHSRLADVYEYPQPAQTVLPFSAASDEMKGNPDYILVFDGGSQGNPGPGYGSYALARTSDGKQDVVRLDFGRSMTNNEAEYETLIAGLEGLIARIEAAGESPASAAVEVRGDSALVIRQVRGEWKTKDDRMRMLRNRVRELLARFKAHRLVLQGREQSVRALGH